MNVRALQRPIERVKVAWPHVLRLAPGAAWFFIAFSLAHLGWVIGVKWTDPAGLTTLYQTTVDGDTYRAWGLSYDGTLGLLLAIVQFGAVAAAAVMSTLKTDKWRRVGHGVLIAWAAMWMTGLLRLAGQDGMIDSVLQATVACLLFGATLYRAVRALPKRPEVLTGTMVSSSDRVDEITPERRSRNPLVWLGNLPWKRVGDAMRAAPGKVKAAGASLVQKVSSKQTSSDYVPFQSVNRRSS